MIDRELLASSYDYQLPQQLIASTPLYPRDSAKLMVYNRKQETLVHTTFAHLLEYLPKETHIILNDTKVIKARLFGRKESGGKIELLFNKSLDAYNSLVLIRGKVQVGTVIEFDENLKAIVVQLRHDGSRVVKFTQSDKEIRFEELILIFDRVGHIPLPPYMHRDECKQDERDYQSLFAVHAGAVAAPTASLHFTPELFATLEHNYPTYKVTLHIGAGTFKPVETENILDHPIHSELFHISDSTAQLLDSKHDITAIGTTVTRTVEYYARTGKLQGDCDLFLNPHNPPQRVDHLLTNFHLPKSTLIMLVSSFVGREKTLALYDEAIKNEYRFFSYGDAMLIL